MSLLHQSSAAVRRPVPRPPQGESPPTIRPLCLPASRPPERVGLDDEFWVVELTTPEHVAAIAQDWDDLVSTAARPNVFLERWMFETGWRAFGESDEAAGQGVTVVAVFRRGKATQNPPFLIGLFPTVLSSSQGRLAGPTLALWQHLYHYDATPLLRQGWTVAAVESFFRWASERRPECGWIRFEDVAADGPFDAALTEWRQAHPVSTFEVARHNRALLKRRHSYANYVDDAVSPSTQREVRRQARRLRDLGEVETVVTTDPADVAAWADEFLALEERGWKQATALNRNENDAAFFRSTLQRAAERGQFEGLALRLDGRAIAMKVNFRTSLKTGDFSTKSTCGAVAFKIAYDETFKKYSPGVLLELDTMRLFHEQTDVAWIDSCASAAHPMIDRLWAERTTRTDVVLAVGGWRAKLAIGVWQAARWLRRSFRRRRGPVGKANF